MPPKKGTSKGQIVVQWDDEDAADTTSKGTATAAVTKEPVVTEPANGYFDVATNPNPGILIYGLTPAALRMLSPEERRKLPNANIRARRIVVE